MFTYNGNEIKAVNYNGKSVKKVLYNGTEVWSSAPAKQILFNFPFSSNIIDTTGQQTLTNYTSATGTSTVDFSQGYSFDAINQSGTSLGIINYNYAALRLSDITPFLVGTGDFGISAEIYIPLPSEQYYRRTISVFSLNGDIPANTYRQFTFGIYLNWWYSAKGKRGVGIRYPTDATTSTDIYSETEYDSTTQNLFDVWIPVKLEKINGVTTVYFEEEKINLTSEQYSLQSYSEYTRHTAGVYINQQVSNFSNASTGAKIRNVQFWKYNT